MKTQNDYTTFTTSPPIDQVRVIQSSMRCFVFGLLGLIPILGLVMAGMATRLQGRVANETGEDWNLVPLYLLWAIVVFLAAAFAVAALPELSIVTGILLIGLHFCFFYRRYAHNTPGVWNPARNLVYWGAALAYFSLMLTIAVLAIMLAAVLNETMR